MTHQNLREEKYDSLVVIFHAYGLSQNDMKQVEKVVKETMPNAEVYMPQLPFGIFSRKDLLEVVNEQLNEINIRWVKNEYKSIILIGHSLGAALARKLYICACGQNSEAPFENSLKTHANGYKWAANIERIILLAAVNRGWSLSPHLSKTSATLFTLVNIFENSATLLGGKWIDRFIIFKVRRGSELITNFRLQWLEMQKQFQSNKKKYWRCACSSITRQY